MIDYEYYRVFYKECGVELNKTFWFKKEALDFAIKFENSSVYKIIEVKERIY